MEENNNAMDFFKRIKYAIFKVEKYGEFLEEKPSVSIKYMFTLLLIVSLIITIITTLGLISLIKQGENYIKTELNDFSFENNKLYFNGNQEAYDAKTDFTFVANTTEISNEQLSEYKNKAYDSEYAIILLNNIILLKVNDSLNEFSYEEINKDNQISTLNKADLIIFSSGSLYTSIIPHLINKDLVRAINHSKAKKMYICNLFTQPGETDGFKVSDHIKVLENYLGNGSVNLVLANDKPMSSTLSKKYATSEQKDPVILDVDTLENMNVQIIKDTLYVIENGYYRHDSLKTAYLIFSYLMDGK